jgi:hypothetical protein
MRTRLAIAAVAAGLAFGAVAAHAAPLAGPQVRQAFAPGEFRGSFNNIRGFVSVVWRFQPNGQVTAVYIIDRNAGQSNHREEGRDAGTWTVNGNQICVQFQTQTGWNGCYTVDVGPGTQARLVGPISINGTLNQ